MTAPDTDATSNAVTQADTAPRFLTTPQGRRIAYRRTEGAGPGIVFLSGFKSDMKGTKAVALEDWARRHGRAYLRFDYSGHGESEGEFTAGCIGDWAEDARAAITQLTEGPQILVGSSMGGWISLLMTKAIPDHVAGLVTIAAAPISPKTACGPGSTRRSAPRSTWWSRSPSRPITGSPTSSPSG